MAITDTHIFAPGNAVHMPIPACYRPPSRRRVVARVSLPPACRHTFYESWPREEYDISRPTRQRPHMSFCCCAYCHDAMPMGARDTIYSDGRRLPPRWRGAVRPASSRPLLLDAAVSRPDATIGAQQVASITAHCSCMTRRPLFISARFSRTCRISARCLQA